MNARRFRACKCLAATTLPLAHCVAGCHGGEIVFGAGSGVTCQAPICTLVTSTDGAYFTTGVPVTEVTSGTADVTVDESAAAQTWEGFGGAFNERGWSSLIDAGLQDEALPLLFGEDGCRFVFGRIPIGASDYALDRYTLDETAGDYQLEQFSLDRDRLRLIPYVRAAQALNPNIRFWACPWTPPTWMKLGATAGPSPSPFDGSTMMDNDAILQAYARYLTRFVSEYESEGISIATVSPQNEPSYEQHYPSCRWTPALYTKFVGEYLGPTLNAAGVSTKVMLGTLSKDTSEPNDNEVALSVRDDARASEFIGVIGLQWDMLSVAAHMTRQTTGLPLWQTEHQGGNYPFSESGLPISYQTTAPNDQAYAVESWGRIKNWIKAGVNAYYAWNMVLDKAGQGIDTTTAWSQNALLVVDGGKLIRTPAYYVFRHLSQFVAPQARVLGSTDDDALTFKNPDGSIIAVVYNGDAAKRFVVAVQDTKLAFDMPGNGWATLRYAP
jgi:glucosylceramidase